MNLTALAVELNQMPVFCLVMAGLLGLCLGSFLNVVILRVPARLEAQWRQDARDILGLESPDAEAQAPGIEAGSRCPACHAPIRWFDNIPLVSYLVLLRGRCRSCKQPISAQYPIVEAVAAAGCVGLTALLGVGLPLLLGVTLWLLLLALAVIDFRTMLLPDGLVYGLLWIGLLGSALGWPSLPSLPQAVFGAAAGWGALWAFYWAFRLLRGKEGLGYGDFKLYAALGAWCGVLGLIPVLAVATLAGLVIALGAWLVRRDALGPLPFGPSLAVGGMVQWLAPHWMEGALRALSSVLH